MQSLESIKKRIKSIQTTAKITNAMKLVATAKIKKQKNVFITTSNFCAEYYNLMGKLLMTVKSLDFLLAPTKKPKTKAKLWIVITSSLGLCGAYNNNICKLVLSKMQPNDKLAVFGKKGYAFFKSHGYEDKIIFNAEAEVSSTNFYSILPLCYKITDAFIHNEYREIHIGYTKFINSLHFEPTTIAIFPIDQVLFKQKNAEITSGKKSNKVMQFEPSREVIVENILPLYVSTTVYGSIIESSLCENSSRRNTMDNASKNADELIDNFKLVYNQLRQEGITQEINEIVSGANGNE